MIEFIIQVLSFGAMGMQFTFFSTFSGWLQLVQNAAIHVLIKTSGRFNITQSLAFIY